MISGKSLHRTSYLKCSMRRVKKLPRPPALNLFDNAGIAKEISSSILIEEIMHIPMKCGIKLSVQVMMMCKCTKN